MLPENKCLVCQTDTKLYVGGNNYNRFICEKFNSWMESHYKITQLFEPSYSIYTAQTNFNINIMFHEHDNYIQICDNNFATFQTIQKTNFELFKQLMNKDFFDNFLILY